MAFPIRLCHPAEFEGILPSLADLLHVCVEGGASVNFLLPFSREEALQYWKNQHEDIASQAQLLLVAAPTDAPLKVCGCVMLKPALQPNQTHRADVGKMLVHPSYRRRGLGSLLLQAVEREARLQGRWLLTLDTEANSGAQSLYIKQGYIPVGTIPDYALLNDGKRYTATTLMYKLLEQHDLD